MKCDMTIERRLDGFTDITITTPKGTKVLMNPVCKKEVKGKLIYKLTKEYIEDVEENKKSKKTK
jgi:hypothetical protein